MEEYGDTIESLASISQQLNTIQMLFIIFMVSMFFMAGVFLLFWKFASTNANADNIQSRELLSALRDNTVVVKDVLDQFKITQGRYWRRNTAEHRQTMRTYRSLFRMVNHMRKSLVQISAVLEASDLLDTKEMIKIQARDPPPEWVDPSIVKKESQIK